MKGRENSIVIHLYTVTHGWDKCGRIIDEKNGKKLGAYAMERVSAGAFHNSRVADNREWRNIENGE